MSRLSLIFAVTLVATLPLSAASSAAKTSRHWAFQPIRRPAVPTMRNSAWSKTPIDAFVLARLEASGQLPNPTADPRTLLRRLHLDLIGLPPTPEQAQQFVEACKSDWPRAIEQVVDRLLASPQFGERWGRHWLDAVRYAETNGYERDNPKPNAWKYRDYVIDALNRDLPFDRFLVEQLAGDEVPDADGRTMLATTFLRLGTWDDEPADEKTDRYDQLDDVLGTTASVFLGQTLRCARCHDHKFEPFSQADYYRMLAVFEPLKRPQRGRDDLDRPVGTRAELKLFAAAQKQQEGERADNRKQLEELDATLRRQFLDALTAEQAKSALPPDALAAIRLDDKDRSAAQKAMVKTFQGAFDREALAAGSPEQRDRRRALEKRRAELEKQKPAELPRGYVWYEDGPTAPTTRLFRRGDPTRAGDIVPLGIPAVLTPAPQAPPLPTEHSTGRRLWLAQWLTRPDHPLTARVIVNRLWQHHFGVGLVATPNDLGIMGARPSHPELLDWLASELIANGWRLKPIHRLIVLSSAYQTASTWTNEGRSSAGSWDRATEETRLALFGRFRQRRLEAETIRDQVLAVSGQLNPAQGGPSVYPPVPRAVQEGQSRPGSGWGKSSPREAARRSIYVHVKRTLALPELELLDAADNNASCEQRPVSTTAPQALTLLNGEFMNEQARHFAERIQKEVGDDPDRQVGRAFELALSRRPTDEELRESTDFLRSGGKLAAFCLVLLNTNEFAYLN